MNGDTSVFITLGLWMVPTVLAAIALGVWHSRRFTQWEREQQKREQGTDEIQA